GDLAVGSASGRTPRRGPRLALSSAKGHDGPSEDARAIRPGAATRALRPGFEFPRQPVELDLGLRDRREDTRHSFSWSYRQKPLLHRRDPRKRPGKKGD